MNSDILQDMRSLLNEFVEEQVDFRCSVDGDHDLNVEFFGGPRFWKMSTQDQSYLWDVSFAPGMQLEAHDQWVERW